MIDIVQSKDVCLYEIKRKGAQDTCYVVVPNPEVGGVVLFPSYTAGQSSVVALFDDKI